MWQWFQNNWGIIMAVLIGILIIEKIILAFAREIRSIVHLHHQIKMQKEINKRKKGTLNEKSFMYRSFSFFPVHVIVAG